MLSDTGGKSIGIETARVAQCDDIEVADGCGTEVKRPDGERRQCGVHALTKPEKPAEESRFRAAVSAFQTFAFEAKRTESAAEHSQGHYGRFGHRLGGNQKIINPVIPYRHYRASASGNRGIINHPEIND